jgi:hypothetical protein
MRNILTIAGKELRGYFVSPMGWVVMGLFALLFGYFFYAHLEYFVSESMRSQGGPVNVNQRQRDHPVPAPDDHDAHLRGGKAVRHNRTAPDVAD